MKRLQLTKALSELEASNSLIVTRTKRTMRNALIVAAGKQGTEVRVKDIQTYEARELIWSDESPITMHTITMRIDIP